ncbi:ABC transporter substrate-binding protein [Butyrivibrio sp. NC3005]|uniref:ABC transporter substrate-binding protein n=1 Tax=Butyrivibrio sp. NC3005 TaxID=1280685 RepID=UPI0006874E0A|nr:ABC transporter substrate-binding protein [Butyrivibrio sp. NC3005]
MFRRFMWSIQEVLSNKKITIGFFILIAALSIFINGCGDSSEREYPASVTLFGGSGRAYIESPCKIIEKDGLVWADIVWSSKYYDYMVVDGERYEVIKGEGNSEFIIPVELGKEISFQADTTAMGTPHLIDYTAVFTKIDKDSIGSEEKNTERASKTITYSKSVSLDKVDIEGLKYISTDQNEYATCFRIYRYSDDCVLIAVRDGRKYLLLPKDCKESFSVPEKVSVLKVPITNIYLGASAVMSQFDSIGAIDSIKFVATKKDDWYIDSVLHAMDNDLIKYGGKYSAPDYETLVASKVDAAIENTMILHSPKVTEKLEKLGIPVFIDWSSYEDSVLGRLEWIKVYGILTGREDSADKAFAEQITQIKDLDIQDIESKSVVVFSLNSNHQIVTKKKNDYLVKMIECAGGKYLLPKETKEDSRSQMTISIEAFYSYAKDADIIIYNGVIEDAPDTLEELKNMDITFKNLKAVKNGNVWCVDKALYQYTSKTGTITSNIYDVLKNGKEKTQFLYKLSN